MVLLNVSYDTIYYSGWHATVNHPCTCYQCDLKCDLFTDRYIVCYLLSNRRNLPLLLCESIIFKSITVQNTTSLADSHWYTITGSGDVKHGFYFPAMLTLAIFSATSRHLYTCDVTVTKKSSRDRSVVKIFIEKVVKNEGGGLSHRYTNNYLNTEPLVPNLHTAINKQIIKTFISSFLFIIWKSIQ